MADSAGRIRLDALRRAPGRGAYVCPALRCIRAALQRGAFARGLRRRVVAVEARELAQLAAEELRIQAVALAQRALRDGRAQEEIGDPDGELERLMVDGQQLRVTDPRARVVLASLIDQMRRLRAELASPTAGALK